MADDQDERINSREDWLSFIDLLIDLKSESSARFSNLYWLVLPLLVTIGWGTLEFMNRYMVDLRIFALSLFFISLLSLGVLMIVVLFSPLPKEDEFPTPRESKFISESFGIGVLPVIFAYGSSILAIVLLWDCYNNIAGYLVLGYLSLNVITCLIPITRRRFRNRFLSATRVVASSRTIRLVSLLIGLLIPFLVILIFGYGELHRETWFLPFELAIMEGGIFLSILAIWIFSLDSRREKTKLDNYTTLRYEITRDALSADKIESKFEVLLELMD